MCCFQNAIILKMEYSQYAFSNMLTFVEKMSNRAHKGVIKLNY